MLNQTWKSLLWSFIQEGTEITKVNVFHDFFNAHDQHANRYCTDMHRCAIELFHLWINISFGMAPKRKNNLIDNYYCTILEIK